MITSTEDNKENSTNLNPPRWEMDSTPNSFWDGQGCCVQCGSQDEALFICNYFNEKGVNGKGLIDQFIRDAKEKYKAGAPFLKENIMKRYLIFAYDQYYPLGGMKDLKGQSDDFEEAKKIADQMKDYDYVNIYDTKHCEYCK